MKKFLVMLMVVISSFTFAARQKEYAEKGFTLENEVVERLVEILDGENKFWNETYGDTIIDTVVAYQIYLDRLGRSDAFYYSPNEIVDKSVMSLEYIETNSFGKVLATYFRYELKGTKVKGYVIITEDALDEPDRNGNPKMAAVLVLDEQNYSDKFTKAFKDILKSPLYNDIISKKTNKLSEKNFTRVVK